MSICEASFGRTCHGQEVRIHTLTNRRGLSASLISYGAAL